ncbi:hypothetical protein J4419_03730 [Candidatus Woesearchaeota archaeon]|nr:hypothetical protein [Candidatus Woesearchaeota archaeon]
MNGCEDCVRTMHTEFGEMSVDICKMLGSCICGDEAHGEREELQLK